MGRLVVAELISIDGVSEAPGGEPGYRHTNWVGKRHEARQIEHKFQEVLDHEALLLGRVTYESFADAWPTYEGPFADRMNGMPKYVVSSTLNNPSWNNTSVLQGEPMAAVARLKQSLKGDILVEFVVQGAFVKVTAIDPVTGLEASIVGPASAPQRILAEQARRKLDYVAKKKS